MNNSPLDYKNIISRWKYSILILVLRDIVQNWCNSYARATQKGDLIYLSTSLVVKRILMQFMTRELFADFLLMSHEMKSCMNTFFCFLSKWIFKSFFNMPYSKWKYAALCKSLGFFMFSVKSWIMYTHLFSCS